MKKLHGFTLIELLVTISIVAILTTIALPNLNEFTVKLRVDNQISEMHRLLLTARNAAINSEYRVTICALNSSNTCTDNWQNEISVFIDTDGDGILETGDDDKLIKVKEAIKSNDKFQFPRDSLTFTPSGRLTNLGTGTFKYCPYKHADLSRGIIINFNGRPYTTSDTDNDGKDEDRSNDEITCS